MIVSWTIFLQALRKRKRLSQKHEDAIFLWCFNTNEIFRGEYSHRPTCERCESETFNWVQTYTYCFLLLLNALLLIFYKHFVSATVFLGLGYFVIDQKSRSGFKLRIGTFLLLFRCDIHTQNLLKVSVHKGRNWNFESFLCLTIGDQ